MCTPITEIAPHTDLAGMNILFGPSGARNFYTIRKVIWSDESLRVTVADEFHEERHFYIDHCVHLGWYVYDRLDLTLAGHRLPEHHIAFTKASSGGIDFVVPQRHSNAHSVLRRQLEAVGACDKYYFYHPIENALFELATEIEPYTYYDKWFKFKTDRRVRSTMSVVGPSKVSTHDVQINFDECIAIPKVNIYKGVEFVHGGRKHTIDYVLGGGILTVDIEGFGKTNHSIGNYLSALESVRVRDLV